MAHGEKTCACCGHCDGVEEHHLFLRSQGCPDDLTVFLCHVCHGNAHGMSRRLDIKTATTAALAHKKARKETYCRVPLGYDDQDGKLVPIDVELRLVAEIRAMRRDGQTLRAIAANLNGRGIVGKRGGRFYASTVLAVVKNSLYLEDAA
jgi:hypothetical protein